MIFVVNRAVPSMAGEPASMKLCGSVHVLDEPTKMDA